MIVVDASAILEVLLNTQIGLAILRHIETEETIHVPHLIDLEVLQVLRRYARTSADGSLRVEEALQDYAELRLKHYAHRLLMPRIWELRHNFTVYAAAYIALAEALDAPLLTCDRALGSGSGHRAKILLF